MYAFCDVGRMEEKMCAGSDTLFQAVTLTYGRLHRDLSNIRIYIDHRVNCALGTRPIRVRIAKASRLTVKKFLFYFIAWVYLIKVHLRL